MFYIFIPFKLNSSTCFLHMNDLMMANIIGQNINYVVHTATQFHYQWYSLFLWPLTTITSPTLQLHPLSFLQVYSGTSSISVSCCKKPTGSIEPTFTQHKLLHTDHSSMTELLQQNQVVTSVHTSCSHPHKSQWFLPSTNSSNWLSSFNAFILNTQ